MVLSLKKLLKKMVVTYFMKRALGEEFLYYVVFLTALFQTVLNKSWELLTKMDEEGQSYEDALADAQNLGFAEANPTADVEGLDAARKMVILARLSFLTDVELDDVDVEGISELSIIDLDYGKKLDLTMKL